jgi:hypothetical protein
MRLRLMLHNIDELGTIGQPIWPLLPITAYFLQGLPAPDGSAVLSTTVHTSDLGWGLTARLLVWPPPTLVHAPLPEALAAGCNALTQPCWGSSWCPWCAKRRPNFVILFPPTDLVGQALAKAQQDQAHCIAILSCTAASSWWLSALHASRSTVKPGQPFFRLRGTPRTLVNPSIHISRRLAVFHFDFWNGPEPRPHGSLPSRFPSPPTRTHHGVHGLRRRICLPLCRTPERYTHGDPPTLLVVP